MARPSTTLPPLPLIPQQIATYATPPSHQIAKTTFSYLLLSLIPTLRQATIYSKSKSKERELKMISEGLLPAGITEAGDELDQAGIGAGEVEGLRERLEKLGERVGGDIAERLSYNRPRPVDPLEIVKFICKDIWLAAWGKQIDNLRTNHRGVFVLQDASFPTLTNLSSHLGAAADLKEASIWIAFPTGVLRGALSRLGLPGTVTAETQGLPQLTFQIKTTKLTLGPPVPSPQTIPIVTA